MPESVPDSVKRRIAQVVYAYDHALHLDPCVADMAAQAQMSDKHFQRAFKTIYGESPKHYVRRLRLQVAAYLLKWSGLSIIEIAGSVGFETHAGFTKAFTKQYGSPPSAFRDNHSVQPYLYDTSPAGDVSQSTRLAPLAALNVRIEEAPPQRVAAMRFVGAVDDTPSIWPKMLQWADSHNLLDEHAVFLGIHNDYWQSEDTQSYRYDAALVVPEYIESDSQVTVFNIPAGPVAMTEFEGRIADADRSWERFVDQWLPISGYTFRESYVYDRYTATIMSGSFLNQLKTALVGYEATLCIPVTNKAIPL